MKRDRGFALAAVMFLLVGAAAAAGVAQISARADAGRSEALVRQSALEAAIDGAAVLAAADLLDADFVAEAPALDGSKPAVYSVGEARVRVRAVSEAGLLNVNLAEPQDIAAVIRNAGGNTATVSAVSGQLSALRRDGKTLPHPAEMRALFEEDAEAFRKAAPFFTARSSTPVDAAFAPPGLLAALPRLQPPAAPLEPTALPIAGFPVVALFLEAELPSGARQLAERIVTISPAGDLLILESRPLDEAALEILFGPEP